MRNALATVCQLIAVVGVLVASYLISVPVGILVTSVAVGMFGAMIDPSFRRVRR